jgi:hypothetical protein
VCLLRVFGVNNEAGDSGDVVIEKQGFSIVDTHEPAIAKSLSPFFSETIDSYTHSGQIFPIERRQEVRRFGSPGLRHITLVSNHHGMSRNERHTSILFGSILSSPVTTLFHHKSSERLSVGVDRATKKCGEGKGGIGVVRRSEDFS